MNIREYAKIEAERFAGVPILASEVIDARFDQYILEPAIYEYYIHAPFEWSVEVPATAAGFITVAIPDLATVYPNWPQINPTLEASFVGLVGFGFTLGPPTAYSAFGTGNFAADQDAILESQLIATLNDQTLADSFPTYDPIGQSYSISVPSNGKLGIIFGYRLNSYIYIKPSHALVFGKIVTRKYLELLVSGRSLVQISGDVTLDITALTAKLDLLNEDYEMDVGSITTPVNMWG